MDKFELDEKCEILSSLDKERIIEFCKKNNIDIPDDEEIFWAGVHKAILKLFLYEDTLITCEQFNKSFDWLLNHGYVPLDNNENNQIDDKDKASKVIPLLEEILDVLKND